MTDKAICRNDGRCEYAIQSGAEGNGHCPAGKCAMPQSAAHLTIPGALEWDGDNGTHGADGESRAHGDDAKVACLRFVFRDGQPVAEVVWFNANEVNPLEVRELDLYVRPDSAEVDQLRAQLANTEQSRRSFFDLSQDLEKRLAERDALLRSKSGDLIQYAARLLGAPLRELNGLIGEGARMTRPRVEAAVDFADSHMKDVAVQIRHIADALSAITKPAKPKTCIECDQPHCPGVCVERGDQDYDRDQAAKGGEQ